MARWVFPVPGFPTSRTFSRRSMNSPRASSATSGLFTEGRAVKAARFPSLKSLESFDFTARPSVNKPLVAELARGEFIDRRENVLLVGNPGTGKTHLAIGLSAAACA